MIICNLIHGGRATRYDLGEGGRLCSRGARSLPMWLPDAANAEHVNDVAVVTRIDRAREPA